MESDTKPAIDADWLGACRAVVQGMREVFEHAATTEERARETGTRGSGGDQTLIIDDEAEKLVFAELERIHDAGHRFCAVSEERGEVDLGDRGVIVIVDPIDGSLNAKRGIPHHALSLAVASGPQMGDVEFAYVYDFGPAEEWWARRGAGAYLNDRRIDPELPERCSSDGRLEVLGIESADPRWVAASAVPLSATAHRLRAMGTIASTLCQVAAARFDGMVSLRRCRGVDAAAGQLIVREGGGCVSFPSCPTPLGAPLTAEPVSPVIAARSHATLTRLEGVPR